MKRALAILLLTLGCHDDPRETAPIRPHAEEAPAVHEVLNPLEPSAPEHQDNARDGVPVPYGGSGAASGAGAASGGWMPDALHCPGPVFLRVRNASSATFDSAEIDGIQFGAVRVGALSKYRQASGCVYWYGSMEVTSGKERFLVFPIDFVGEAPLKPGYYTQALTTEPSSDPGTPGGLKNKISRDPPAPQ